MIECQCGEKVEHEDAYKCRICDIYFCKKFIFQLSCISPRSPPRTPVPASHECAWGPGNFVPQLTSISLLGIPMHSAHKPTTTPSRSEFQRSATPGKQKCKQSSLGRVCASARNQDASVTFWK